MQYGNKKSTTLRLTLTAVLMAMNIAVCSFGIPVPGGHLYLCDVVIDPECRHRGLGKALVSHIASLPEFAGIRGFLFTRDAHGLYEKYGFEKVEGRVMVRAPGRV